MSAENWHEERDRLIQLLQGIESGAITHIDEDDLRQLQATNPENVAVLKERLAKLNVRLGDGNSGKVSTFEPKPTLASRHRKT